LPKPRKIKTVARTKKTLAKPRVIAKPALRQMELSNPFSTGGGGVFFECAVQSGYVVKLITGGSAPCIRRSWPIVEIKLQGKHAGFQTDDFIAFAEEKPKGRRSRLLAQIKHTITVSAQDPVFQAVIAAAWTDFKNPNAFDPEFDAIALITGPLSAADIKNVRSLLDSARKCSSADEFFAKVKLGKFTSATKRGKLTAFNTQVKRANQGIAPTDDEFWRFLKAYHLLGYDLDQDSGGSESIFKSLLTPFTAVDDLWNTINTEVGKFNVGAGTITKENLPPAIRDALKERVHREQLAVPGPQTPPAPAAAPSPQPFSGANVDALVTAALTGGWSDKSTADLAILQKISGK
jgi:hypothetical protein